MFSPSAGVRGYGLMAGSATASSTLGNLPPSHSCTRGHAASPVYQCPTCAENLFPHAGQSLPDSPPTQWLIAVKLILGSSNLALPYSFTLGH